MTQNDADDHDADDSNAKLTHQWLVDGGNYTFAKDHNSVRFTSTDGKHFGTLDFQDGPIKEHGINGTTNEEVLTALIERLQALNQAPYACKENACAITHLQEARMWLYERTRNRQERQVEGTSTP